jgi:primosomal protein N' (replication factor Y) (superfamily II helicase)
VTEPLAAALPYARVVVDSPLHHLDRLFDYGVPESLGDAAQPGTRVRVRFAGRLVDGFLVDRSATTDHTGSLARLAKVVSPEPVLAPEIYALARAVADRWAGTVSDVLRLAVPPRHARAEAAASASPPDPPEPVDPGTWSSYPGGAQWLAGLAEGRVVRAVWTALPGPDWPAAVATAAAATLLSGRGVLVVVPDARDLARVDTALASALGGGRYVLLTAEQGPAARYRSWLRVRRGEVRCVAGTRAAAWAPVADLGLVVCWDDGDDLHKEPRAPYPHVRDVLVIRSHLQGAGALVGGFAPSVEAEQLVARGWAQRLAAGRDVVRLHAPRITVSGDDAQTAADPVARAARLPSVALTAARTALRRGEPVLVQVPRSGYQPALACADCRAAARCPGCAGPLARSGSDPAGSAPPSCRWCGRPAAGWRCAGCRGDRLRAVVVGSRRTAEELGRAFPGAVVRTSDRGNVLATVDAGPAVVVATPGAEPVASGGYGAVLLLDGFALLTRPDLRAGEEALRRWCAAAALARPAADGGRVVLVGDPGPAAVQALVRWDPAGLAAREYAERAELHFPPAARVAAVDGPADAVGSLLEVLALPTAAEVLGPVPLAGDTERVLVRVPWRDGADLSAALHDALAVRSAKKLPAVRVELDPLTLI